MESLEAIDWCELHDRALAEWYEVPAQGSVEGTDLHSLVKAQHQCNFMQWGLEDEVRRTDVADSVIAGLKRSIDRWNQRRNDLIEAVDDAMLAELADVDTSQAEQHSETAGQIIDRLSVLSLKVWYTGRHAWCADGPAAAAEWARKVTILKRQRADLAKCLQRLLADCRAGRRFFKSYRQFKSYKGRLQVGA